jgi:3-(methylthio)propionyl---CoA ligase
VRGRGATAACIATFHPKWDERPLLVVMKKPGATGKMQKNKLREQMKDHKLPTA